MQQLNLTEESAENREQRRLWIQATESYEAEEGKTFFHKDFMKFHFESLENNFENGFHHTQQKKEDFSTDRYSKI